MINENWFDNIILEWCNLANIFIASLVLPMSILVMWLECWFLDTMVDSLNPGISMLCPLARHFIRNASVDSCVQ